MTQLAFPSVSSVPLVRATGRRKCVLTVFGTRPEVIKLAPVIHQLEQRTDFFRTVNVTSGQHAELLHPFVEMFDIRIDKNLQLMKANQTPSDLCERMLPRLQTIVENESPDLILVQGDTTTALAGAVVSRRCGVPVGHVEAGLRSGNLKSPYPEEMNRRLITQLASYHFAATRRNLEILVSEGVPESSIFLTGNPVVDALQMVLRLPGGRRRPVWFSKLDGRKYIVLTTHRRESFGQVLADNLKVLCNFVRQHSDISLLFPVHPNPNVSAPAKEICAGQSRVIITPPLGYKDFIQVLSRSWLVVSDSGGVQEEVPSVGKPLLILRENTERAECIDAGVARLVGRSPESLRVMLEEAYQDGSWIESVRSVPNPFGNGDSGARIADCLTSLLQIPLAS
jgi:UDP-N-acetylglucosamine 2-epimerase (non-hydrolysing)